MNKDYDDAVKVIKTAILASQLDALKSINEKQLILYYAIGKYISYNTKNGKWGENAIDEISRRLDKELPGLKGFSSRNLRSMRQFYEEWRLFEEIPNSNLEPAGAIINKPFFTCKNLNYQDFISLGFTLHRTIFARIKDYDERIFYIKLASQQHFTRKQLEQSISRDDYHHQGQLPNNFSDSIPDKNQAIKAIAAFKD